MSKPVSRRDALKQLGAAGAGLMIGGDVVIRSHVDDIVVAGQPVEVEVGLVSPITVRVTLSLLDGGRAVPVPITGELVSDNVGEFVGRARGVRVSRTRAGRIVVKFAQNPPTLRIETTSGALVQRLTFDAAAPGMSFLLGDGPCSGSARAGRSSIAKARPIR